MTGADTADPNSSNSFSVPFVFVAHGDPLPEEWMAQHPDWVRFPATMVPPKTGGSESEPEMSLQAGLPEVPPIPAVTGEPFRDVADHSSVAAGGSSEALDQTASAVAAWRDAQAVIADPMAAAGLVRVTRVDQPNDPTYTKRESGPT